MTKKEVFVCDFCGKASSLFEEGAEMPYNHGWRFLDSFEFKTSNKCKHETIRKQFCSAACMISFVQSFTIEQEGKVKV
jgi:predicted metal-binding protein